MKSNASAMLTFLMDKFRSFLAETVTSLELFLLNLVQFPGLVLTDILTPPKCIIQLFWCVGKLIYVRKF